MDPNALLMLVMLVLIGSLFYFSSRARKKQALAQQRLRDSVVPGSRVTTIAGLQATVTAIADDTIELEIAPGVRTTWMRAAIRDIVVPAVAADAADESDPVQAIDDGVKKDFS